MLPVRRLVLAVEEHEQSPGVSHEASMLASLLGAQVVPVHVTMSDSGELPALAASLNERLSGPLGVAATEVHLYRPGATVADAVLSAAKDHSADLIVLGAGRKSALDRVFCGSTTESISRRATVPVWVVRPAPVPRQIKTVLCAVDDSPAATQALQGAIELARAAGAKLIVLAIVGEAVGGVDPVLAKELQLRNRLLHAKPQDVDMWVEVLKGDDPPSEILKQVERCQCDVLVLGQAGREGFKRLWNSNTADAVVRSLPCSLLTIHAKKSTGALNA
jgi:nucleotide-binding universal stress UspA family protein